MFFPLRSAARALTWSLALESLQCGAWAFVFRARSASPHDPARCQLESGSKHEVNTNAICAANGLLASKLAIRGGATNVRPIATQEEFEAILIKSGNALVCVDFTAAWCSPCQQIAPAFEQLSEELTDVVFVKVDVDENEETTQKYDVFQMPTFLFMRNGEVVDQFSGANPAVLRQKIELLLGSDKDENANDHGHEEIAERKEASGSDKGAEATDTMHEEEVHPGAENEEDRPSGKLGDHDP